MPLLLRGHWHFFGVPLTGILGLTRTIQPLLSRLVGILQRPSLQQKNIKSLMGQNNPYIWHQDIGHSSNNCFGLITDFNSFCTKLRKGSKTILTRNQGPIHRCTWPTFQESTLVAFVGNELADQITKGFCTSTLNLRAEHRLALIASFDASLITLTKRKWLEWLPT